MKIAVIGGGIGGLAAAWGLVQAGHAVTVFERAAPGSGASGLALGALVAVGPHVKGNLAQVERASVEGWPELARQVSVASGVPLEDFFREWLMGDGQAGYQLRLPEFFGVLAAALRARGVVVHEHMPMTVETALAQGFARVVLGAGWANAAAGVAGLRVVAGQALRVRLAGNVRPAMQYRDGVYVVPCWPEVDRETGQNGPAMALIGSENTAMAQPGDGVPDESVTASLLQRARMIEPLLLGAEVVQSWVGYRPAMAAGLLPLVRPLDTTTVAVTGLGKLGFCLAPAVASAFAEVFPRA